MTDAEVHAWRPSLPGVSEVFHAYFAQFSYPMHTHATWTLLLVEGGQIHYDLGRRDHDAATHSLTLLPPHVPHNGSPGRPGGFRKRVLYLEEGELPVDAIGAAVDTPDVVDDVARRMVARTHDVLRVPGSEFEAESRLAIVKERLRRHLTRRERPARPPVPALAQDFRDVLDDRTVSGITLREASAVLHAHPAHLVRSFSLEFGITPHQYLLTRRVDLARRLILTGMSLSEVAAASGFCDQPHLSRSFKRVLGVTPGRYAMGARAGTASSGAPRL
ncbi:MAG TPA: AraC family transcriptional regulator [Kineosporiaceae bacterium]